MPPPPHRTSLVTKHPYYVYQHQWMNASIFKSIPKWPYDRTLGLEKIVISHFTFYTWSLNFSVWFWVWENTLSKQLCVVLGVGKYNFFLYVTLLCVVMCGDRKGPAHWNVLIMFILGVVPLIFTKPNSKMEKDCLVKRWDQHFLMYKIKQY
jgi:hypothetical protein